MGALELGDKVVEQRAAPRAMADEPYRVREAAAPAGQRHAVPALLLLLLILPVAVLLPARWRARLGWDGLPGLRLAAGVLALAQVSACVLAFGALILHVDETATAPLGERVFDHLARGSQEEGVNALHATGGAIFVMAMLSWWGLAIVYLLVEGLFRGAVVLISEEIVPSGPLAVVDAVAAAVQAQRAERRLGPLVADEVTRSAGGGSIEIASCRARGWTRHTLLQIDDDLWQVVASSTLASGPRRHVYRLERAPAGVVARGRVGYRPDELVAARAEARRSFWRQLREELVKMIRPRRRPPT